MLPFEAPLVFEGLPKFFFCVPKVVPDQKGKFEQDEIFRRLSRESEVISILIALFQCLYKLCVHLVLTSAFSPQLIVLIILCRSVMLVIRTKMIQTDGQNVKMLATKGNWI